MKLKYLLPTLLLGASSLFAQNTQLTGTINNPDGSGFTGTLYLTISQVAGISPNGSCGGPVQVAPNQSLIISLVNGTMTQYQVTGSTTITNGAPKMYGSDCTLPAGVPYIAVLKDPQGNTAFNQLWEIVGSTQNIGTVTSNVPNPQALYISIINAIGAPTGVCSNTQVYNQTDATPGINTWWCENGTWTQQIGGGGGSGGMSIGGAVTGGTSTAVLYVNSSTQLAQDPTNFFYTTTSHTLSLLNLSVTNTINGSISGNSATTTLASNSTQLGGIASSGYCQTGGTNCPAGLTAGGTTGSIQGKSSLGGLQASDLADNYGVSVTSAVPIVLPANPTSALQAATKQYVDSTAAGFTGAIISNPAASQTITQPDGTNLIVNNAGTSGVNFQLGAHVNFVMVGGTISLTSPDSNSSISFTNTGITFAPSISSYLNLGGRLTVSPTTLTTSTTIGSAGESVDFVNATSGALAETLPAANATTTYVQTYQITKTDSSANAVTVTAGSGDTINGASTFVLPSQYSSVKLVSNGVHTWFAALTTLPSIITGTTCGDSTHYCIPVLNAQGLTTGYSTQLISSGITLQTNGINNPLQTIVNLVNGPGITITNDSVTGKTQINNTYAVNPTPIGVSQNVDWPPTITNAMNDEFTDVTFNLSNIWTVVNQGSDTIANKNSLLSVNAVAHSGDNFVGIYQLTPSTPYAVTAKLRLTGVDATGYYAGLGFRDSATGKVVAMRIGNGSVLTVDYWTNPTTISSSAVCTATLDADQAIYMTLKDDGTNFTFSFSRDGVNFITLCTEGRTAFLASPGQVGYIAGSSNATWPMALGSDWFRRTL